MNIIEMAKQYYIIRLVVEITYDFGLRIETGTERPLLLYIIYKGYFILLNCTKTAQSGPVILPV